MANVSRWPASLRILVLFLIASPAVAGARIAIIIDDLGYRRAAGQRAAALDGPVALAILPHTPFAAELATLATANGKEVLLHLPLEPVATGNGRGIGRIELDLTPRQFARVFSANLASVPLATGVNTHMGSLITQHPGHMAWLMHELQRHGDLFFVDSRTTPASVALRVAQEFGVPATRRDVFLDDDPDPRAIAEQFRRLVNLARVHGRAVAIGHPHPNTLEFLETALPALGQQQIELVPVKAIIHEQQIVAAQ